MSEDHVEGLVVSRELVFKSVEIRTVPDVGLLDFNQEVVVLEGTKPVDPSYLDLLAEFAIV